MHPTPRAIASNSRGHQPKQQFTIPVTATGEHPPALDTTLARLIQPENIEHHATHGGKVLSAVLDRRPCLIIVQAHVQAPVQPVLHLPVAAYSVRERAGVNGDAADV